MSIKRMFSLSLSDRVFLGSFGVRVLQSLSPTSKEFPTMFRPHSVLQ